VSSDEDCSFTRTQLCASDSPLFSKLVFVCLLKAIKKKYCVKENGLSFYLILAKMQINFKKYAIV